MSYNHPYDRELWRQAGDIPEDPGPTDAEIAEWFAEQAMNIPLRKPDPAPWDRDDSGDEAADMLTTRSQLHIEAQGEAYWDGLSDAEEGKPNRNPHRNGGDLWAAYEHGYREGQEGDTE